MFVGAWLAGLALSGEVARAHGASADLDLHFGDDADRGRVEQVLAPAGRDRYFDVFTFGETTPTEERNALSHLVTRTVDDLGRVLEEMDPNGVTRRTVSDAFGRAWTTEVRGAGAADFRLSEATVWYDDALPTWSETEHFDWNPDGTAAPSTWSYAIFDGFGRTAQTWTPADAGWVVVDVERDVRGNPRWRSEPHVVTTFTSDYDTARGTESAFWSYVDVLGAPVSSWSISDGTTQFDSPEPGTVRTQQGEGYVREDRYDTHGRRVRVLQGRPAAPDGPLDVTAIYVWDGQSRVQRFVDGGGNEHRYDYDGVGRVRQVWRRPSWFAAWEPWVGFAWDGPDPISQTDGELGVDPEVVSWTYDDLGRTVGKEVWDVAQNQWHSYGWTWDADPAGVLPSWIGARHATTDPTGDVTYAYGSDPVFGGFGWPTSVERTWFDGTEFDFAHDYDAAGRVLATTWPSGSVVSNSYHPNGWREGSTVTLLPGVGPSASVSYTYDATFGTSGFVVASGLDSWEQVVLRDDSVRIRESVWTERPAGMTHSLELGYDERGWLESKVSDNQEPLTYT